MLLIKTFETGDWANQIFEILYNCYIFYFYDGGYCGVFLLDKDQWEGLFLRSLIYLKIINIF